MKKNGKVIAFLISLVLFIGLISGIVHANQRDEIDRLRDRNEGIEEQLEDVTRNLRKAEADRDYWETKTHQLEEGIGVFEPGA